MLTSPARPALLGLLCCFPQQFHVFTGRLRSPGARRGGGRGRKRGAQLAWQPFLPFRHFLGGGGGGNGHQGSGTSAAGCPDSGEKAGSWWRCPMFARVTTPHLVFCPSGALLRCPLLLMRFAREGGRVCGSPTRRRRICAAAAAWLCAPPAAPAATHANRYRTGGPHPRCRRRRRHPWWDRQSP